MGEFMDHHAGSNQCCQSQPAHQAKRRKTMLLRVES